MPMPTAKPPVKHDNGAVIAWLLVFSPVGLYMMWKYATWPDIEKGFITLALVAITLILLLHGFA
jgi:hypothetical protein